MATLVPLNGNAPGLSCPTRKKSFANSSAAESFASDVQLRNPGSVRQHAYACEECSNWHLSAMDASAHAMVQSRSNFSEAAKYSAPGLPHRMRHLQSQIKETYQKLFQSKHGQYWGIIGETMKQLEQFGVSANDNSYVREFLAEVGLYKPETRAPYKTKGSIQQTKVVSIDTLTAEERELESKLRELQAKKQALIEARAIKFSLGPDKTTVVIRKEFQTFALTITDAQELAERLVDFLAAIAA